MFQGEFQPFGKFNGIADSIGQIGKELFHFSRRADEALRIDREQAPRILELAVMTNAGEDVEDLALGSSCISHSVSRQERQTQPSGDSDCCLIACFFAAIEVALQLDIYMLR